MKTKPINPYSALLSRAQKYRSRVINPVKKGMWQYPKNRLDEGWALKDLWERTAAANQLGYDVKLEATDAGLEVKYVLRPLDEYF